MGNVVTLSPEELNRELEKLRREVSGGTSTSEPSTKEEAPTIKDDSSFISTAPGNSPSLSDSSDYYYNPPHEKYTPLAFEDPIEMLFWLDDNIAEGKISLHEWQIEELLRISSNQYTKERFLSYHLCACNGSGKDAFIIAVIAVFLTVTKIRHRCTITSSSFKQLDTQTEAYIRIMAERFNDKMKKEGVDNFFRIKKGFLVCNETGSEMKLFVTDEAGKAEGDHPFPDYPGAEMCIIINEAKSVPPEIFTALRRCTGFNRWIEVSSPGKDEGDFYENFRSAVLYPASQELGKPFARRVTCYDCPHISKMVIEDAKRRLRPIEFKSIYLAEFTSLSELVMIKPESLNDLKGYDIEWVRDNFLTGGLDLSLGGDETVLVVRDGNKTLSVDAIRIGEAPQLELILDELMGRRQLNKGSSKIFTDVGGLGKPIAQHLVKMGWKIVFVQNNEPALNHKLYGNRAAEDWARVSDLVERKHIIIPFEDSKLIHQLGHRYYEFQDDLKIKLEKKKDAKARGVNSPDRADAFVLAFVNFRVSKAIAAQIKPRLTQEELLREMEKKRFQGLVGQFNVIDNRLRRHKTLAQNSHARELLGHFVKERKQLTDGNNN